VVVTIKFNFHTPEVIEAYTKRSGEFKFDQNRRVNLIDTYFQSGSMYLNDTDIEVMRLVRPVRPAPGVALINGYACLRLENAYVSGHSFLREYLVGTLPNTKADHEKNKAWYVNRVSAIINSQLANWSKFRTALMVREEMRAYEHIFHDISMPGVTTQEAALLSECRIFNLIETVDFEKIVDRYQKLYGNDALEKLGDAKQ
jgi:hypothetical protein